MQMAAIWENTGKTIFPDDPGFYEKFYFSPGDTGYQVFNTRYARIGVLVCWDQWYPEAARITSLMGAEILFYPTAIGWASTQTEDVNTEQFQAWQTIQRSHAIANGVHVVAVNRTGHENGMKFWGGSFVVNPFGTVLYQASHDEEVVHVADVDLSLSDFYRTHWPFMRDRRIDTYKPIASRYIKIIISLMSISDLHTPAELGYRFPAEWEKHAGTWLSYPHNEASWPGKIHTIFPFYHEFIRNLAKGEMVNINVILAGNA